jgi:hypothetical protein
VSFPLPGIPSQGEPFFSSDGRSLYVVGAQRIDRWYMR